MHRALEKQLKDAFGEHFVPPLEWRGFLGAIDARYTHFDEDHIRLNHSLEIVPQGSSISDQCFCDTNKEVDQKVKELQESLEKYQALVENLSLAVCRSVPGQDGYLLEVNPAFVTMMEADSKEELLKHKSSDFYERPEQREHIVHKIIKSGFVKNEEVVFVTLKGKKITVSVSAVMKKNKHGDVYFDAIIEDITARKATEDALRRAYHEMEFNVKERTGELSDRIAELDDVRKAMTNLLKDLLEEQAELLAVKVKEEALIKELQKFKLAVDNVSDLILITDPEGIVLYVNNAVEKITGYTSAEAIGKNSGSLWKDSMSVDFYKKLWRVIKDEKKVFLGEIRNVRKSGEVYISTINISPILNEKHEIEFFVAIQRDITKEKEIDKAKTEFVSLASHQLRTPLSTINWYTEMLLSGDVGTFNDGQKKYLEEVYRSNQRMVTLVNALLNVSRLELGTFIVEPEQVDVIELVQSVISEHSPEIHQKNIVLSTDFDGHALFVHADPKLLRMVVQNLVSNAVKYTPNAGKIFISLSSKNGFSLKVSDTGLGIPKHQQRHIFEKLFRADNVREKDTQGTGLGLYIVKSILDYSGGKVWFESEENKGSTFYVSLPLEGMKKKEGTKTLAL